MDPMPSSSKTTLQSGFIPPSIGNDNGAGAGTGSDDDDYDEQPEGVGDEEQLLVNGSYPPSTFFGGGGDRIKLHRCRTPPWNPSAISCIALTPPSWEEDLGYEHGGNEKQKEREREGGGDGMGRKGKREKVAVGRANGEITIMEWIGGHQGWVEERTIPSPFPSQPSTSATPQPSLLSHLLFIHPTFLPLSDSDLYHPTPIPPNIKNSDSEEGKEIQRQNRELEEEKKTAERKLKFKRPRLIGVGGTGKELIEWRWTSSPLSSNSISTTNQSPIIPSGIIHLLPSLSSTIFSLSPNPSHTLLALGCSDSSVRIVSTDDDTLEHVDRWIFGSGPKNQNQNNNNNNDDDGAKKKKGRSRNRGGKGKSGVKVLSMAWGRQEEQKVNSSSCRPLYPLHLRPLIDSYLIAGCSDSCLRKFDAKTGKMMSRMTVDKLKGEQTLVWTVGVLDDDTVLSGDSMGNVKIWDGRMGTQLRNLKAHKADVLCLSINFDGRSFFTSGVDQRTTLIQLTDQSTPSTTAATPSSRSKLSRPIPRSNWIVSSSRRLHAHDVRAIAVSPAYDIHSPDRYSEGYNNLMQHHGTVSTASSRGRGGKRQFNNQQLQSSNDISSLSSQPIIPILLSGGIDMSLILTPALATGAKLPPQPRFIPSSTTVGGISGLGPLQTSTSIYFDSGFAFKKSYVPQLMEAVFISQPERGNSSNQSDSGKKEGCRLMVCKKANGRGVTIWRIGGDGKSQRDSKKKRRRRRQKGTDSAHEGGGALDEEEEDLMEDVIMKASKDLPAWAKPSQREDGNDEGAWGLAKPEVGGKESESHFRMVADMDLQLRTSLTCMAISSDGRWLALSDLHETKLFFLRRMSNGTLIPRKSHSFASLFITSPLLSFAHEDIGARGSTSITFSPDSSKLVCGLAARPAVLVVALRGSGGEGRETKMEVLRVMSLDGGRRGRNHRYENKGGRVIAVNKRIAETNGEAKQPNGVVPHASDDEKDASMDGDSDLDDEGDNGSEIGSHPGTSVMKFAISSDGQWFAAISTSGLVNVYSLDSLQPHCILPTSSLPPCAISFIRTKPSNLAVFLPDNTFQIYNVETHTLADWARALISRPIEPLKRLKEPIKGVCWPNTTTKLPTSSSNPMLMFIWSSEWVAKLDLNSLERKGNDSTASPPNVSHKRRREDDEVQTQPFVRKNVQHVLDFRIRSHYDSVLGFGSLGGSEDGAELACVERPFFWMLDQLPGAWTARKYGT